MIWRINYSRLYTRKLWTRVPYQAQNPQSFHYLLILATLPCYLIGIQQQQLIMIKRDVLHRADIKTVYSSERQERMKVYFQLTEQYNQCIEPCRLQPNEAREECLKQCEKIYDQYAQILKSRYEDNKERLDMEVKGLPSYRKRARPDRQGWFYDLFGMSFGEFAGNDTTPNINTQERRI